METIKTKENKMNRSMNIPEIKNFKMNNEVYQLRRKVIDILYQAKDFDIKLPRINVRIGTATEKHKNVLGVGGMKNIWITEEAISKGYAYLLHVVLHELCHSVYNLPHDEKCELMSSKLGKPCNITNAWKIFKNYSKMKGGK
jgi:hypothetical protein